MLFPTSFLHLKEAAMIPWYKKKYGLDRKVTPWISSMPEGIGIFALLGQKF